MKTMFLAAALAATAAPAQAQQTLTCDTFGTMTTCRGPNGYRSTEDTFGTTTTGRDSLGNRWATDRFGAQTTTRFQPNARGW